MACLLLWFLECLHETGGILKLVLVQRCKSHHSPRQHAVGLSLHLRWQVRQGMTLQAEAGTHGLT